MRSSFGGPVRCACPAAATSALALLAAGALLSACGDSESRRALTPPAPARVTAVSQKVSPMRDFDLTVENLNGLYLAHHELYRLSQTNPEPLEKLQEAINEFPDDAFANAVQEIVQTREVREAILRARISPREYFLTQLNLVDAVNVLEARAAGRTTDLPDVTERNVEFVRLHPQEVRRVMTERRPPNS
jgi:hypothetical protein